MSYCRGRTKGNRSLRWPWLPQAVAHCTLPYFEIGDAYSLRTEGGGREGAAPEGISWFPSRQDPGVAHSSRVLSHLPVCCWVLPAPAGRAGDLLTSVCSETSLNLIRATLDFIDRGQNTSGEGEKSAVLQNSPLVNYFLAMWAHWEEHSRVITEKGDRRTVKNGTKWERMDKLMIREDFFFLLGVVSSLASLI